MSTQTAPPTTRQLANRLRSTLEWIEDHADTLPTGWEPSFTIDSPTTLDWWSRNDADPAATFAVLVQMFGEPTLGTTWAAEGDRPMMTVYGVAS